VRAPALGDVLDEPVQLLVGGVRVVVAARDQHPGQHAGEEHRAERQQALPPQPCGSGTPAI
jgi:hypothetical protein